VATVIGHSHAADANNRPAASRRVCRASDFHRSQFHASAGRKIRTMNRFSLAVSLLLVTLFAAIGRAADEPAVVQVETKWSGEAKVAPGGERTLAVIVNIADEYHINPDKARLPAGSFLIPTSLKAKDKAEQLPGVTLGAVQFPEPKKVEVRYTGKPATIEAYEHQAILYVPVTIAKDAALGARTISFDLTYQACNATSCLPPKTIKVVAELEVVKGEATTSPGGASSDPVFANVGKTSASGSPVDLSAFGWSAPVDPAGWIGFIALLAFAAAGGLLLNFTPCVLPVIPIKMMGLSKSSGNRARCFFLGLMMSLGVVAFWIALGAALCLVSGFTATNELFGYPAFTLSVGVIIAVMAIGMGGFFTIPLPRAVYQINPQHGSVGGSIAFGVMTAVLSTPCTAPFMGGAAAWAVTQSAATTLIVFAMIGIGMALPYAVLSAFPSLIAKMPRTGPASDLIKQVMGLLMLAAAAYFLGVGFSGVTVNPPDPPSRAYWWVVMFFIAAAGVWLVVRTVRITPSAARRVAFGALGLLLIASAAYGGTRLTSKGPIDWVYYTPERFKESLAKGNVIVMDYTAEWCINCKVIEATVLNSAAVVEAVKSPGVVPMKVDLTKKTPETSAKLEEVGRVAIPVIVVFSPDGTQVFNSDAYTIDQVLKAIEEAKGKKVAGRN